MRARAAAGIVAGLALDLAGGLASGLAIGAPATPFAPLERTLPGTDVAVPATPAAQPEDDALRQAQSLVDEGAYVEARGAARRAHDLARTAGNQAVLAQATLLLAELARLDGDLATAGRLLDSADALGVSLEASSVPSWTRSAALRRLARAHLLLAGGDATGSRIAYREAADLGRRAGDEPAELRALIGELALTSPSQDASRFAMLRDATIERLDRMRASDRRRRLVLELAAAFGSGSAVGSGSDVGSRLAAAPAASVDAARAASGAAALSTWIDAQLNALADSGSESRWRSLAHGLLAQRDEERGRTESALDHARRAAFAAQGQPELQYRWLWLSGRLLERAGDSDGAITGYRLAAQALDTLTERTLGPESKADAAAVGLSLANLLLRKASALRGHPAAGDLLREARRTVESLKAAELRDYFRDDCVTELQARITPIDQVPAGTAVIYPIQLAERLELLVSLPGDIRQVTVDVGRHRLVEVVRQLRNALEKRATREYLTPARQLYRWLIDPLAQTLAAARIDTLVFVPDSALRLIPMGALHDGQRFLIERFAIAATPGLQLTDARPLPAQRLDALLAGISKPVQGLPPLRRVPAELAAIHSTIGGLLMEDEGFALSRFAQALERRAFTVVHIASHAEFDADPARSFVAAFDDKIGLERLGELIGVSQYRTQPIELLVLSACQTAAGDERAALGLAGIAVKSGARSAVAGLWAVDDAAAAVLMADFYTELGRSPISRARALQRAQVRMIADRRYTHPGFWAPFLLIGNWL